MADDNSRVILDKVEGDPDSDYINANYIDVSIMTCSFMYTQNCFITQLWMTF